MTGISLVSTGMLTPSYTESIRNAEKAVDRYTYESNDIRVIEVPKEFKFLNIH